MVKTIVTSELIDQMCESYNVACYNTLTGFKYIATVIRELEGEMEFIGGGEESYGYLGSDAVRDKDANGATLMFAEVAAYAKSVGKTLPALLDDIYAEFGYYLEIGKSLVMEGADGAAKIQSLAASYADNPPTTVHGSAVLRVRDFAKQDIYDQEGDLLPKEKMLFVDLEDGRSFAVRPSGTEPKIKYYLFGKSAPGGDLATSKADVRRGLDGLWSWIEADAATR